MPKYLKTKEGSLESAVLEAVSPAQQAAIAISKKEKGEKPKNEEKVECPKCKGEGCDHCDGKGYHTTEELSAKQKKIDLNKNGKVDGDDLAQLRKKANKEEVSEGFFSKEYEPGQYKNGDEKPFVDAIKKAGGKNIEVEKPTRRDPMLTIEFDGDVKKAQKEVSKVGDGTEDIDENTKNESKYVGDTGMVERAAKHIADMWKEASKSPKKEEEDPKKKESKTTMTGKPMSGVEINPKSKED